MFLSLLIHLTHQTGLQRTFSCFRNPNPPLEDKECVSVSEGCSRRAVSMDQWVEFMAVVLKENSVFYTHIRTQSARQQMPAVTRGLLRSNRPAGSDSNKPVWETEIDQLTFPLNSKSLVSLTPHSHGSRHSSDSLDIHSSDLYMLLFSSILQPHALFTLHSHPEQAHLYFICQPLPACVCVSGPNLSLELPN